MGTTTSSTGDPICEQQQQRVQVYYPSVYYTSGGEQMIRSTAGFLQESDLSSAATAEYGFSCVEPSSNACLITSRKASSGCGGGGGGGGTRQHVYDIPHRFKKDPTAVCLMSRSSTVCPVADVSLSPVPFHTHSSSLCATNDQMKVAEVRAVKAMP